jgi:hypothetical protein
LLLLLFLAFLRLVCPSKRTEKEEEQLYSVSIGSFPNRVNLIARLEDLGDNI